MIRPMKYRLSPDQKGLSPHHVRIVPYDPVWKARAKEIAQQLHNELKENIYIIEHIGSTSIPGLSAKPVIDLLPIVWDMEKLDAQKDRIIALGYKWHDEFGITGRRFCTLSDPAGERLVHLHFFQKDADPITRHLAFRDYLLEHPSVAKEYEKEKLRAAALHPDDSMAYNDEKSDWVQAQEKAALTWYLSRRMAR